MKLGRWTGACQTSMGIHTGVVLRNPSPDRFWPFIKVEFKTWWCKKKKVYLQKNKVMDKQPQYIRFDWAMKRLLRDKANFGVLEGFLTTLLGKTIKIQKLLESESNQENEDDKQNRVDVLAEDDKGELYLIEVQNESELAYFQRMLFGTSKLVTEYINRGENYEHIRKVYSVNIVL